ncbi:heme A synthase [Colwelliaceae bacterium MEBiC 14330]
MTEQEKPAKNLHRLVLTGIWLAIFVIGLGAYTRLTHAGLGCPDWPGCYGLIDVPQTSQQIAAAEKAFPERPFEAEKAWNEMIHRYFAGALGILIAIIAFLSIKLRLSNTTNIKYPLILPLIILALVTFQAALGMWTVTLKLMPIIVMAHLLGGFSTLCLLFLLHLRIKHHSKNNQKTSSTIGQSKKYSRLSLLGVVILTAQIALGGWTSSNYAAMSCIELPICQGDWFSNLTFNNSFDIIPPDRDSYEFGHLEHNERVTIHVTHRLGAIVTAIFITWLATIVFLKARTLVIKRTAIILFSLLVIQLALGVSNIWFSLPLNIAVAHNLVAAFLMLSLITLTYKLRQNPEEVVNE